jgi:hypothetical protein
MCMATRVSNQIELFADVLESYGLQHQVRMCAEEAAEFIVECLHLQRYDDEKSFKEAKVKLIEEVADVQICTEQMIQFFDLYRFSDIKHIMTINGFDGASTPSKLNTAANYGSKLISICLFIANNSEASKNIDADSLQLFALNVYGVRTSIAELIKIFDIGEAVEHIKKKKLIRLSVLVHNHRLRSLGLSSTAL